MCNIASLLLAVPTGLAVALFVVLPIIGLAIGGAVAWVVLKKVSKKKSAQKLDDTEKQVEELLKIAESESHRLKKEVILEAQEQEI